MKITVITPSVRPEMLEIVGKCLSRQTFKDFEWIVVGPDKAINKFAKYVSDYWWTHKKDMYNFETHFFLEPKKTGDEYYKLNAAWNTAFELTKGDLIVSVVDGLWFPPDTLERLWQHYQTQSKAVISCIGHQYDQMENGKPEHMVWRDPRARLDQGSFYETSPVNMEWCVASFPTQAIYDIGGMDEEFDNYAALSEKEACFRMEQLGYRFYLDQSLEYRAIKHDRLSEEWDERYNAGCEYYSECLKQIADGKRLKLDYLKDSVYKLHTSSQDSSKSATPQP